MRQPYPVIQLQDAIPSPHFIAWVHEFKITRLARSLGINRSAVHSWITSSGKRRQPRTKTVRAIVALSKIEPLAGETILTYQDILGTAKAEAVEVRR